jgi:hypothetical protein
MPKIPWNINGVSVQFASQVNAEVDQYLLDAMAQIIKPDIAPGATLMSIWISSASDHHNLPSRHAQGKAVDISRINGKHIALFYPGDQDVKAIVDAIQQGFEQCPHRRENFGPLLKLKHGDPWHVGGHSDHVHLSVD